MLKWLQPPHKRWQQWRKNLEQPSRWHVLDFNRHSFGGHDHVLHLERHDSEVDVINFFIAKKEIEVNAVGDKFSFTPESWRQTLVSTLEAHLGGALMQMQHQLKQSPPEGGDAVAEARGEEWIKTSLVVLERALSSLGPDHRLQTSLFIGHNKNDNYPTLRIIVFNLDISFTYQHSMLHVLCFNKREQANFDYSKPDFEGAFSARAFPLFDRASQLTQLISEAILREALREKV